MLAVPNGSCFCLLNSQLTAIPWGLLINGDFLGLDGWTIWISHGSGWNDYAFVKGEPSLLVIYGMFYGEKWTPTEAILPSTHPLKRHDTWNLLVFFSGFLYWPSLFEPFPRWTKFELPNVWRVHPCCLPPNFVASGLPLMLLLAAACWISRFWW